MFLNLFPLFSVASAQMANNDNTAVLEALAREPFAVARTADGVEVDMRPPALKFKVSVRSPAMDDDFHTDPTRPP